MKRSLLPLLLLSCAALSAPAAAQLPNGRFLTTYALTAGGEALAFVEPLKAGVAPISFTGSPPGTLRCAIFGSSGAEVLLALQAATSQPDVIQVATLQSATLGTPAAYASGFTGAIKGMVRLNDGRLIVCTTDTIYEVPGGGGPAVALVQNTSPLGCLGIALSSNEAVVVASNSNGTAIHRIDLATKMVTVHPITVPSPTAIGEVPALQGYFIGDTNGDVWLVNGISFVSNFWASGGRGAVTSLASNRDQRNHMFGTTGQVQALTGLSVSRPIPITGSAAILCLDYFPYESSFTTYGTGCKGSNNKIPAIGSNGVPFPGNATFALTVRDAAPNAPAALLFGAATAQIDLTTIGAPGCKVLLQPLMLVNLTIDAAGDGILFVPIPAEPALVGGPPLFQWVIVDPMANGLGIVVSNGGRGQV